MGSGHKRRIKRALAGVVPKRDLDRALIAPATIAVAAAPAASQSLPEGEYALALVDAVLYLAQSDRGRPRAEAGPPRHVRLRLDEAELAMAFGGPPFHSTLHFEHPAVGRLVVSLPALELATKTEAAVARVHDDGGSWLPVRGAAGLGIEERPA